MVKTYHSTSQQPVMQDSNDRSNAHAITQDSNNNQV